MAVGAHHYLVADSRETHVTGLLGAVFRAAGEDHKVAQLNTGDYLICRQLEGGEPEVLAAFERKTLPDFAASFRDGRHENRHKLLDLRVRTGAAVFYLVEGPAFPQPTWRVGRVPYSSILSAMTNLMVRDGVLVVQTENEAHTAQRLLDFLRAYRGTPVPYAPPPGEGEGTAPAAAAALGAIPGGLTGALPKADELLAAEVWGRLRGVSVPTGQGLAARFSGADLVSGGVAAEALAELRGPSGRQLGRQARASLAALRTGDPGEEARILAGVPGLSPAMAKHILRGAPSLAALLADGGKLLREATIPQKGREVALGPARAERALRVLTYGGKAPEEGA